MNQLDGRRSLAEVSAVTTSCTMLDGHSYTRLPRHTDNVMSHKRARPRSLCPDFSCPEEECVGRQTGGRTVRDVPAWPQATVFRICRADIVDTDKTGIWAVFSLAVSSRRKPTRSETGRILKHCEWWKQRRGEGRGRGTKRSPPSCGPPCYYLLDRSRDL